MLAVDDYARLRRAFHDGMSLRAIARTLHHTQRKIREALQNAESSPYTRTKSPTAPSTMSRAQQAFLQTLDESSLAQFPTRRRELATPLEISPRSPDRTW